MRIGPTKPGEMEEAAVITWPHTILDTFISYPWTQKKNSMRFKRYLNHSGTSFFTPDFAGRSLVSRRKLRH
jgi:hypothetical protein